jgi:ABC-2 type transport system ATP-binding protein
MIETLDTHGDAPLLELRKVLRQHTTRRIVQHELRADLVFEKAEVIGVFGPNGSGKSTLMDLMAGRIDPTEGQVKVRGHGLRTIRREQRRQLVRHLCQPRLAAPQVGGLQPLVLKPRDLYLSARESLLDLLRGPAPQGGPQVHVFDEPPLEQPYGGLFFERFRRLRSEGALVLFSAHPFEPWHLARIEEVCDRYLFIQDGSLTLLNGFHQFMAHPEVIDYMSGLKFP